jgi:hypothetical protein
MCVALWPLSALAEVGVHLTTRTPVVLAHPSVSLDWITVQSGLTSNRPSLTPRAMTSQCNRLTANPLESRAICADK